MVPVTQVWLHWQLKIQRGNVFLSGDSGEGLGSRPPRCKIKEEPKAVMTNKFPLLPELVNVL